MMAEYLNITEHEWLLRRKAKKAKRDAGILPTPRIPRSSKMMLLMSRIHAKARVITSPTSYSFVDRIHSLGVDLAKGGGVVSSHLHVVSLNPLVATITRSQNQPQETPTSLLGSFSRGGSSYSHPGVSQDHVPFDEYLSPSGSAGGSRSSSDSCHPPSDRYEPSPARALSPNPQPSETMKKRGSKSAFKKDASSITSNVKHEPLVGNDFVLATQEEVDATVLLAKPEDPFFCYPSVVSADEDGDTENHRLVHGFWFPLNLAATYRMIVKQNGHMVNDGMIRNMKTLVFMNKGLLEAAEGLSRIRDASPDVGKMKK